ncbi:MAG: hypothetical protein V4515_00025 [Chloroflexota bacterium]
MPSPGLLESRPPLSLPTLCPLRAELAAWADATYGPRGWAHVSIVVERTDGGPADVIHVRRAD